jgi:hypothetical protein
VIRTAFPISRAKQIQLRFETVARRTRRALEERRRSLRTESNDSAPVIVPHDDYLMLRWRDEVHRKRASYETFYDRYDNLIGLICISAQEGITLKREEEYREQRSWFMKNYPLVKRELVRYLESDHADSAPGMWGKKSCDNFEALFLPYSLKALLKADEGDMIQRLMVTQSALASWEELLAGSEAALHD